MARIQQVLRMATAFALGGGCTAQVDDPTVADDEAVLDHVEALGFERSEARVLTDRVVADGDIIFNRESLLRGEYERWESVDDAGLVEKGYRYPGRVAEKHRGNIKLLFATGRFAPTKEIRSAFLEAAKAWSKIPGSSIRISPDSTGPAIVVRTVPVERWTKYAGCKDTDACAYAPYNGRPGYDLFIRAESIEQGCTKWSPSALAYVARHELGHSIGFAHPKEKGSKHVKGTKACGWATEDDCTFETDYVTVMGAATSAPRCVYSPARVTQDDFATCIATYPAN